MWPGRRVEPDARIAAMVRFAGTLVFVVAVLRGYASAGSGSEPCENAIVAEIASSSFTSELPK